MKKLYLSFALLSAFVAGALVAAAGGLSRRALADEKVGARDCFGVTTWVMQGKSLNSGNEPKNVVHVPEQYEVVGGGSGPGMYATVVVCSN